MFKTVNTYTIAMNAYIAKGRLEAEGIPATIADEYYITLDWTVSVAIGGVRVQVPHAYLDQAKQVITDLEQGKYEVNDTSDTDESLKPEELIHCPKCNSTDTHLINWSWKLSLVILFLSHFPFPFLRHVYKCKNDHYWIATEERGQPIYITIFAIIVVFSIFFIILSFLSSLTCDSFFCIDSITRYEIDY